MRRVVITGIGVVSSIGSDAAEVTAALRKNAPKKAAKPTAEVAEFLEWLAQNHFTFLGYREFRIGEGRKQGAKLVESVNDIVEELGSLVTVVMSENITEKTDQNKEALDADYKVLLDSMAYDPISIDRLIELTGLTIDSVSSMLLILELRGLVVSQAGGVYIRAN